MKQNNIEILEEHLSFLSLHKVKENYISEAEKAAKTKLTYQEYLSRVIEIEMISKIDRSINRRIQLAGFPQIKHLEEFDFSYQPQLDELLIRELSNMNFLSEAKNILLLGPPGVGKSHLAISLGIKAATKRKRVSFYTAENLTTALIAAEINGNIIKFIESLARLDLLIIDELGYLELNKSTATLFFKMINKRYESGSIIVTSNKPFEEWGQIFQDDVVASAILDRLLHHSYPFFIQGKSFRTKNLNTK
ncbi:MAG TPA: IS21-like element helper ATPase IstB [Candidatus Paceibacterota bacterium]|nr:IS21-like element helper ATPase IstB [Candidatus Paceibacterota bacterium]